MTNFSKRLRELRLEKGLTQKELAKELDMTQVTISYWESGEREPSINYIRALADYFDVTTDYLLGREE